jgi:phospholipid transport system substrate-binding protein
LAAHLSLASHLDDDVANRDDPLRRIVGDPFMIKRRFSRRGIVASAAGIFFVGVRPRGANADDAVLAPIRLLNEGLLRAMKAGQAASFSDRFNILAPIIDQTFDLTTILKDSVGLEWQSLPPGQQATLLDAFRRYTVASYVNSFDSYDGQRLLVNPETRAVGADQVVRSQIIPRTGQGHTLDYVMRQAPTGWRIVDVLADGAISRVAVQRSDFRQLIRRGGALALADRLKAKTALLSG